MRIVGGRLRGRVLATPTDMSIRPTTDRLRETIFNILLHALDDPVSGARVLDLFAGTGALGVEAASRGASFVTFVDDSADARGLIRHNVEELGLGGCTRLFRRDATRLGPTGANGTFDLVFCDPPYGYGFASLALSACVTGGWLSPGAIVIVEERSGAPFAWPASFVACDERTSGDTTIRIGRSSVT